MRRLTKVFIGLIAALFSVAAVGGEAGAAAVNITWMSMAPIPLNTSVPSGSVFFVPGVGPVTVTYSMPAVYTNARTQNSCLQNGTLTVGPNTWSWTAHELFAAIFTVGPDPLVPECYTITYTLPVQCPKGSVYLGFAGLGATTSFGGGASTGTVNQNGTFLGDFPFPQPSGCGPWGPTQFTGGAGTFQVQNSLTGSGGQDPWWNTPLGVVRIDDPVSSVTATICQLRGDGVGVNIGFDPGQKTPTLGTSWGRVKSLYR